MSESPEAAFLEAVKRVCEARGWQLERSRIEVPTEAERKQRVHLEPFEFEGEALVRFASPIGPTDAIDPLHLNTALRLNYGLPYGALALRENQLVMVDTLMADDPDEEEIEAVVRYLAETADHFERTMFGPDVL